MVYPKIYLNSALGVGISSLAPNSLHNLISQMKPMEVKLQLLREFRSQGSIFALPPFLLISPLMEWKIAPTNPPAAHSRLPSISRQ